MTSFAPPSQLEIISIHGNFTSKRVSNAVCQSFSPSSWPFRRPLQRFLRWRSDRQLALRANAWRVSRRTAVRLHRSLRRQLAIDLVDLRVGVLEAAVGGDDEIRASGFFLGRPLRGKTLPRGV